MSEKVVKYDETGAVLPPWLNCAALRRIEGELAYTAEYPYRYSLGKNADAAAMVCEITTTRRLTGQIVKALEGGDAATALALARELAQRQGEEGGSNGEIRLAAVRGLVSLTDKVDESISRMTGAEPEPSAQPKKRSRK